jgi:lactoylglutathione lyase
VREPVTIDGLFETHLSVADLDRSIAFYRDVVGLPLALHDADLGAGFFWIGGAGAAMLGLWTAGPAPLRISLHVAFKTSLENVLGAADRLRDLGVTPLSFSATETDEPSVIGWMPAAAIYFRDPDGHLLEYLAMLDHPPDRERRVLTWSEWTDAIETPHGALPNRPGPPVDSATSTRQAEKRSSAH